MKSKMAVTIFAAVLLLGGIWQWRERIAAVPGRSPAPPVRVPVEFVYKETPGKADSRHRGWELIFDTATVPDGSDGRPDEPPGWVPSGAMQEKAMAELRRIRPPPLLDPDIAGECWIDRLHRLPGDQLLAVSACTDDNKKRSDFDCHACQPLVGLIQLEASGELVRSQFPLMRSGRDGKPFRVYPRRLRSGRPLFFFYGVDGNQGYFYGSGVIAVPREDDFVLLLLEPEFFVDTTGAFDPGERLPGRTASLEECRSDQSGPCSELLNSRIYAREAGAEFPELLLKMERRFFTKSELGGVLLERKSILLRASPVKGPGASSIQR